MRQLDNRTHNLWNKLVLYRHEGWDGNRLKIGEPAINLHGSGNNSFDHYQTYYNDSNQTLVELMRSSVSVDQFFWFGDDGWIKDGTYDWKWVSSNRGNSVLGAKAIVGLHAASETSGGAAVWAFGKQFVGGPGSPWIGVPLFAWAIRDNYRFMPLYSYQSFGE